jgi:hypothetical protein
MEGGVGGGVGGGGGGGERGKRVGEAMHSGALNGVGSDAGSESGGVQRAVVQGSAFEVLGHFDGSLGRNGERVDEKKRESPSASEWAAFGAGKGSSMGFGTGTGGEGRGARGRRPGDGGGPKVPTTGGGGEEERESQRSSRGGGTGASVGSGMDEFWNFVMRDASKSPQKKLQPSQKVKPAGPVEGLATEFSRRREVQAGEGGNASPLSILGNSRLGAIVSGEVGVYELSVSDKRLLWERCVLFFFSV